MKTPHQRNVPWSKPAHAAFTLFCLTVGFATRGNAGPSASQGSPRSIAHAASQFAIADFDGDSSPDIATVQVGQSGALTTRYWVGFQLSSGLRQTVGIAAPTGGLQLESRDVNGDSYPDVIVTTLWTDKPVAVLLNDGRGNFTRFDPSAFPGAFEKSESFLTSRAETFTDAAALVFSRYLPGRCEERRGTTSPASVLGRLATGNFPFVALLISGFSLGRAPPSVALHS